MDREVRRAYWSGDGHLPLVHHSVHICYRRPPRSGVRLFNHQSPGKVRSTNSSLACVTQKRFSYTYIRDLTLGSTQVFWYHEAHSLLAGAHHNSNLLTVWVQKIRSKCRNRSSDWKNGVIILQDLGMDKSTYLQTSTMPLLSIKVRSEIHYSKKYL